MARYPYTEVVRDGNGVVVNGASVTVYLAGTTTLATIYSASSGGVAITGSAVTTDSAGAFTFWVDASDHPTSQLFKFAIAGPAALSMLASVVDNIFIYHV